MYTLALKLVVEIMHSLALLSCKNICKMVKVLLRLSPVDKHPY